ncbi:hypothetical protein RDI58_012114 [Solanum bulbocastanum]|uniref:Uncharacterized protein n=1 Tax=Solanum bulbocastanum TaxID=147425 RepID=A0AAN8YL59_SOLBU
MNGSQNTAMNVCGMDTLKLSAGARIKIRGMVIQGKLEKKLQVPKQVWQVVVKKGKPPIEREGLKWENLANVSKVLAQELLLTLSRLICMNSWDLKCTKSKGELISLDEYLSRMQSSQNKIFYLIATKNQLEKSPFIEMLKKKDFEVILSTDDIDPYVVQHLLAYKGKTFHDICQDVFKFYKEDLEKYLKNLFNGGQSFLMLM